MNEGVRVGCHAEADRRDQQVQLESLARHFLRQPRASVQAWLAKQKPAFREKMRDLLNQEREKIKAARSPSKPQAAPAPPVLPPPTPLTEEERQRNQEVGDASLQEMMAGFRG